MAEVGTFECKIHVTAVGIPELEHLLEMLKANVDNLPTIVVRAMEALAESDLGAPRSPKNVLAPTVISGADPEALRAAAVALSAKNQRIIPIR